MSRPATLARYFHTLRHLRAEQVLGRVWFKAYRPGPETGPAPGLRALEGAWVLPAARAASLVGPDRACFLNEERNIGRASAWDDAAVDKLWLYNLHYFDDLNARAGADRAAWHRHLIERWIQENPPATGTGWEPYPTSLRIVNWIKWALGGQPLPEGWRRSLASQVRWLMRRVEWHLLGNHLFANAKALVFAGCFFTGSEAERWLARGLTILERELPEQVLPDGGQFERSPMYHALALEDLLDLINVFRAFPSAAPGRWRALVAGLPKLTGKMRRWLAALCHPDGDLSLFNDAALGIAPFPEELEAYGARLGLPPLELIPDGVTALSPSGYLRVQQSSMVALLDVGPIGPDYLPGHAHADTLSCELSLFGQRVLVNSGTSCYGSGPERQRQRGTAAHNTVTIDGADSSEVWSGFRVARRAKAFDLKIREDGNSTTIVCAHDGYRRLPGRPVHRRTWRFDEGSMTVTDSIEGRFDEAVARYFLHPDMHVFEKDQCIVVPDAGRKVRWQVQGGTVRIVPSTYHPEFGVSRRSHCIEVGFAGHRCAVEWSWNR